MNKLDICAYAKINLSLDATGKYEDGYHELSMIMQSVSFYDKLRMELIPKGLELSCSNPNIFTGKTNTVTKIYTALAQRFRLSSGVRIHIEKNIWSSAGLAGGSTDAAAALVGMNRLFELGLGPDELRDLGVCAGMDTAFCIEGGTAHATGRGNIIKKILLAAELPVVIIKPDFGISTAFAYNHLRYKEASRRPKTSLLIDVLSRAPIDLDRLGDAMGNVLEEAVAPLYPQILEIKERLLSTGASCAMMTGSGSCIYGIYESSEIAKKIHEFFKK